MNEFFLKIINMSISASWLILAVLILRLILKKAPKWVNVLLWGIVAVRLICPFSFESTLSLIPSSETIPLNIEMAAKPTIDSGVPAFNRVVNPVLSTFAPPQNILTSSNPLQIWIPILNIIWLGGVTVLLLYTIVSYWRLHRKVDTAVRYKDNIFQSEHVSSPFVLGLIKPRIYLPFHMSGQDLEHVVAHEQAHIHRKDHWWKPFGFLLLTIHWFNPLMWLAYVLLCRDIELACDEKVIKELGNEQRADYTQALVACSINHRIITACPLAFGEVGVKERVKSVMNYEKPAFWIVILAAIACVGVAVCFLTNPIAIGDHFVLTNSENLADTNKLTYDIQLGKQTMSGQIYAEQWIDGTCVQSESVVMTQYVDSIEISMTEHRKDFASVGTDIQIETNQYGGRLLTYFAHPENLKITGWAFEGHELGEKIKLSHTKEVILAAKVFDNGSGVSVFSCETLAKEPERLKNAAYMIVIRAVFSADPLGTDNLDTKIDIRDGGVIEFISEYGNAYPAHKSLYEPTPIDQIDTKYDNEEFVITKLHYETLDGEWVSDGYTYKYRLEITGRMNNDAKNTTYIVLSNTEDITFNQTWKASGLSSNMADYFDPADAVIVGHKLFLYK